MLRQRPNLAMSATLAVAALATSALAACGGTSTVTVTPTTAPSATTGTPVDRATPAPAGKADAYLPTWFDYDTASPAASSIRVAYIAFALPMPDGTVGLPDSLSPTYIAFLKAVQQNGGDIGLAIGGWGDDSNEGKKTHRDHEAMLANWAMADKVPAQFAASTMEIVRSLRRQGLRLHVIDFDREFPQTKSEMDGLRLLSTAVRVADPTLKLTAAVSAQPRMYPYTKSALRAFGGINIMTYDEPRARDDGMAYDTTLGWMQSCVDQWRQLLGPETNISVGFTTAVMHGRTTWNDGTTAGGARRLVGQLRRSSRSELGTFVWGSTQESVLPYVDSLTATS